MYRTLFSNDLFDELDRLQRQAQRFTGSAANIRGTGRQAFPAINIGGTPDTVEIFAFAPGLDPRTIDLKIERGVLTISGERLSDLSDTDKATAVHFNERFSGRFHRAVSLSDEVDPNRVDAKYRDGVLQISIQRRESTQPRRIEVH